MKAVAAYQRPRPPCKDAEHQYAHRSAAALHCSALHCALLNGSEVIFLDAFDPARLVAELPGASVLMGVPTFYVRLLDTPGFDRSVSDGVRRWVVIDGWLFWRFAAGCGGAGAGAGGAPSLSCTTKKLMFWPSAVTGLGAIGSALHGHDASTTQRLPLQQKKEVHNEDILGTSTRRPPGACPG